MRIQMFTWPFFWRFVTRQDEQGHGRCRSDEIIPFFSQGQGMGLASIFITGQYWFLGGVSTKVPHQVPSAFKDFIVEGEMHNSDNQTLSLSMRHGRDSRILFEDVHLTNHIIKFIHGLFSLDVTYNGETIILWIQKHFKICRSILKFNSSLLLASDLLNLLIFVRHLN